MFVLSKEKCRRPWEARSVSHECEKVGEENIFSTWIANVSFCMLLTVTHSHTQGFFLSLSLFVYLFILFFVLIFFNSIYLFFSSFSSFRLHLNYSPCFVVFTLLYSNCLLISLLVYVFFLQTFSPTHSTKKERNLHNNHHHPDWWIYAELERGERERERLSVSALVSTCHQPK